MIRVAVRCAPELAELVLAELVTLSPGGVEEERGTGYVEYAIYGAPGELPEIGEIEAAAGGQLLEVRSAEIPDDWADRWQEFHRPVVARAAGASVCVRPSWEKLPADAADAIEVVVDPGRAFGTGAHPTTRLCLELMLGLRARDLASGPLADWGTGSGVLAIAAAKLGWGPVTVCDHEQASVEAALANAELNGVELEVERVNLREEPPPFAPTVCANLLAPLLRDLGRLLADGDQGRGGIERIVCSGLLVPETDEIVEAFAGAGFEQTARQADGEWAALLLEAG